MPLYCFKLMASISDRGVRDIILKEELTVAEVKEIVKKEFRFPPTLDVSLLLDGITLSDNTRWAQVAAVPNKTIIRVMGTR